MTFILSLLTGAWGRIAGLLALALGALFVARKSGADAVKAKVEKQNADTVKRMAKAETDGVRSRDGLVDRLRGTGEF